MNNTVPVIDISLYAVGTTGEENDKSRLSSLATELVNSLEKFGLIYLDNHGIPQKLIETTLAINERFFKLPVDQKERYRKLSSKVTGWVGLLEERFEDGKPADLHENFYLQKHDLKQCPKDSAVPQFTKNTLQISAMMEDLASRVLRLIAIGLNLPDTDYLTKYHSFDVPINVSMIKLIYYSPLQGCTAAPGQMRFGEHSDGSTITLLFHNEIKGYEVKLPDGSYMEVPPMPTAILLNAGDMLQRWTSDRIVAPIHRVVMPSEVHEMDIARQTVVYFVNPDSDRLIEPLDGSGKYPGVYPMEYNYEKFRKAVNMDEEFLRNFSNQKVDYP